MRERDCFEKNLEVIGEYPDYDLRSGAYDYKFKLKTLPSEHLTERDVCLLSSLPVMIARSLYKSFLCKEGVASIVKEYFLKESNITACLEANPASDTMLRWIYYGINDRPIDKYYYESMAANSLRNRLEAVKHHMVNILVDLGLKNESGLVLNLGSGSAGDVGAVAGDFPFVTFKNIDTDPKAIDEGKNMLGDNPPENIIWKKKDILKLEDRKNADFGLLIGILCPMDGRNVSVFMRKMKKYFKPGARILAATLLEKQLEKDYFLSWLLKQTTGWKLDYKPPGYLEEVCKKIGLETVNTYHEEDTEFYDILDLRVT